MKKSLELFYLVVCLLLLSLPVCAQEEQGRAFYDLGVFAFEDRDYEAAVENFSKT